MYLRLNLVGIESLDLGESRDLIWSRNAVEDFDFAVTKEAPHTRTYCCLTKITDGTSLEGDLAQLRVHNHHFKDRFSAFEAVVVALTAPDWLHHTADLNLLRRNVNQAHDLRIDVLCWSLAFITQHSNESLRHDCLNGTRHQEWLDSHINQTRDRRGRIIGVQGGEDQVTSKGGLDGDIADLSIANLTDQNHIGSLTEHRLKDG